MKRIAILRHGYYPADARVRKEAQALTERRHAVDVICLRKPGESSRERVDGVEIYRIPLHHRRAGKLLYVLEYVMSFVIMSVLLFALFLKKRYQIIQVNTMPDILVFATVLPKLFGAKVILDLHEAMPEMFRTKYGYGMGHPFIRLLGFIERLATAYADRIIVVCNAIIPFYQRRGINLSKITVITNSPDDRLFRFHDTDSHPSSANNAFTLITHGTIEERYGIQVILRALPHLRNSIPGIKLQIVGDGEYSNRLQELSSELMVDDLVEFTGLVPFATIPARLRDADLGIVPLIKDEFTDIMVPNKLFEYAAMKLPIIATATQGVGEFFGEQAVCLFRSGDENELSQLITTLYRDPRLRARMAETAWADYQSCKWETVKSTYCNIFDFLPND